MNISICVDAVYAGKDFFESLKEIKSLGVNTFEFWCWWDKDLDKVKQAKDDLGLEVSTFCTRFVSLVDASKRKDYIEGLQESIVAAKKLNCKKLISQVGNDLGISRDEQKKSLIDGLRECAPILEKEGITLMIEPLNTRVDHQGYYLAYSEEAFEIVQKVNSPYIKVLFDIYHQQIMEGNLIQRITDNLDKIAHFHAAGNPGRHELFKGEINYPEIFKAIDLLGYSGTVGFEYFPLEDIALGIKPFIEGK
jgi:hydroxypyruvate isomerase